MMLPYILLTLGLLIFALGYHNLDLAYNNKFSYVEIGNGMSGPQMHMAGLVQIFLSVICLCGGVLGGNR